VYPEDVERSRRPEHRGVAPSGSPESVARRIPGDVGFGLYDSNDPFPEALTNAQLLAQERPGHDGCGASIKANGKGASRHGLENASAVAERLAVYGDGRLADHDPGEEVASIGPSIESIPSERERDGAGLVILGLRYARR
jgi:hypothetical protein